MKKALLITGIIMSGLVTLFLVLILVPMIMKPIDPVFKGSAGYYYQSTLDEKCGRKLVSQETELMGFSCKRIYYNATPETDYDRLQFYLFDSEFGAKRAMSALKTNGPFEEDTVTKEDDSILGRIEGTVDAIVYRYYFRSGNLIVSCSYAIPEMMDPDADYDFKAGRKEFDRLVHWIPEEFANPQKH